MVDAVTEVWQDYADEIRQEREKVQVTAAQQALDPSITANMAVRAADIARQYPELPGGIVGSAAFAGLDYMTPQLADFAYQYARQQEEQPPSIMGTLTRPLKFATRSIASLATSAIDELIDRNVRTYTRMTQYGESYTDAWRRAGASPFARAAGQLLQGNRVNLGSSWLPESTDPFKTAGFYGSLEQGSTPGEAATQAIQQTGVPVTSQARRVAESTLYTARSGATTPISLGRLVAVQVTEPGTKPFHILSGAIDGVKQLWADPAYGALKVASEVRIARRVFQAADFAEEGQKAGLLTRGIQKAVHSPNVDRWLATDGREWVKLLTRNSDIEATHILAPELTPAEKLAVTNATTEQAVLDIVRPRLGTTIREVPTTLSRVSRAGGRIAALGDDVAQQIAGVRGFGAVFNYRTVNSGIGRAFTDLPRATLEVENVDQAFNNARDWMVAAKFSKADRTAVLTDMASVADGDYGAMYRVATNMMEKYKAQLIDFWGGPEAIPDALLGQIGEFTDLYNRQLGIRAYSVDNAGHHIPIRGADYITLKNGTRVPIPTPTSLAEMTSRQVLLPDAYDVMRSQSKIRRLTDVVRDVIPGWKPIFAKESRAVAAAAAYQGTFWKPLVLMRPAWTVRVVGEELLRMTAEGYSTLYNHPLDYLAWSLSDRILAPLEDIAGVPLAKGRTGIIAKNIDEFEELLKTPQGKDAMSQLRQRMLSRYGPDDARRPTGAWDIFSKNKLEQLPQYKEGIARDFMQMHGDPIYQMVADVGVEDTFNFLWNTDEGRDILKTIETRAGVDTAWSDITTNADTARLYAEQANFRINIKSGGKGMYRDANGRWLNEMGDAVDAPHGISDTTDFVVTERGNQDLIDFVNNGRLGPHQITDNMSMKSYRGMRDHLYDQYSDFLPDMTKGPTTQKKLQSVKTDWDNIVGWVFRKLGEDPTNAISRGPAFAQTYWDEVGRLAVYANREVRATTLEAARKANVERELLRSMKKWASAAGVDAKTIRKLRTIADAADLPPPKMGIVAMRGAPGWTGEAPSQSQLSNPTAARPWDQANTLSAGRAGGVIVTRDMRWAPLDEGAYQAVNTALGDMYDAHFLRNIDNVDDLKAYLNTHPDMATILDDPAIRAQLEAKFPQMRAGETSITGTYRYQDGDVLMVDTRNILPLASDERAGQGTLFDAWETLRQDPRSVDRVQALIEGGGNYGFKPIGEGITDPLTVTKENGQWVLKDGYHRTVAAQDAGISQVPVRIDPEYASDADEFVSYVARNQESLRLRQAGGTHPNALPDSGVIVQDAEGKWHGFSSRQAAAESPIAIREDGIVSAADYYVNADGQLVERSHRLGDNLIGSAGMDDQWVSEFTNILADKTEQVAREQASKYLAANKLDTFDRMPTKTELAHLGEEARYARVSPETSASGTSNMPLHGEMDMVDMIPSVEQEARETFTNILTGKEHVYAFRLDPGFTGPQRDLFEMYADSYGWARYELDDGSVAFVHPAYAAPSDVETLFTAPTSEMVHNVSVTDEGSTVTMHVVQGDPPPTPPRPPSEPVTGGKFFDNLPEGTIDDIAMIDELAKNHALETVQNLLYDLSRKHGWTAGTRLIFPFGEAWGEVLSRWAQIIGKNGQVLRRAQQAYEHARDSGFVYQDDYGNNVFAYPFGALASKISGGAGSDIRLIGQLSGLNLVAGGLPGWGPAITAPAGAFHPSSSFGAAVWRLLFPYGQPDKGQSIGNLVVDSALPAYMRRFLTAANGEDGSFARAFNSTAQSLYSLRLMENKYQTNSDDPGADIAQVKKDATELTLVRAFLQWIVPTGPGVEYLVHLPHETPDSVELKHPLPQVMTLKGLTNEWAKYLQATHGDVVMASKLFIDRFGVDPLLRAGKSWATDPFPTTQEGYNFWLDNKDLYEAGHYPHTAYYAYPDKEGGDFVWTAYSEAIREGRIVPMTVDQYRIAINQNLGQRYYDDKLQKIENMTRTDAIENWRRAHLYYAMDRWPGFNTPNVGEPASASIDQKIAEFEKWAQEPRLADTDAGKGLAQFLVIWHRAEDEGQTKTPSRTGWRTAVRTQYLAEWVKQWAKQIIADHPDFQYIWQSTFQPALQVQEDDVTFNLLGQALPSDPPTTETGNG